MIATPIAVPPGETAGATARVMVVDDSAVIRGLLARWIQETPGMEVVERCSTAEIALRVVTAKPVDLILLDIELPGMDGLTVLPKLLQARPGVKVIVVSGLSRRNADLAMQAVRQGAVDFIAKPESGTGRDAFRVQLLTRISALTGLTDPIAPKAGPSAVTARPSAQARFSLRPMPVQAPALLAIGSSTGGPQAVHQFLEVLAPVLPRLPVVITQHMPPTFTAIFAEHLAKATGRPAMEATHGAPVRPGTIYVAPGDFHMTVTGTAEAPALALDQSAPVNFCRPAADPLFRSVANLYGRAALGIVLTGMGHDGRDGAKALTSAGAGVFVQDQDTSVVWGMPGAVAMAGLASKVAPVAELGAAIIKLMGR